MRRTPTALASFCLLLLLVPASGFGQAGRPVAAFGRLRLHFEANRGQAPPAVQFSARGPGYTLFLTPTEAVLTLRQGPGARGQGLGTEIPQSPTPNPQPPTVLRMQLVGAHPAPPVTGRDPLPGVVNYFQGNEPTAWRTRIPTYARVHYQGVYPGVDLVYYGNQQTLEYDFHLAPGADPAALRLAFPGAAAVTLEPQGDLVLTVPGGTVRLHKPQIYQEVDGERQAIAGGYVLDPRVESREPRAGSRDPKSDIRHPTSDIATVGFAVAAYDPTRPLVIDPVLAYSTYLGGGGDDLALALAVDGAGNAYVAGVASSPAFPTTTDAFDRTLNLIDAFVAKLTPDGGGLVYSTFLGKSDSETPHAIAVDGAGSAYVAGFTTSALFPTTIGADDRGYSGGPGDAFVTKFTPDGSDLVYSTYLGGIGVDRANAIAVDATGHAYVAGETTSSASFPTTSGALDPTYNGNRDAFVVKLNPTGTDVVYGTYLGGSGEDRANAIAVDAAGNAYVAGDTASNDFPVTAGASGPSYQGNTDGFVTKLSPDGMTLTYSTFLGGAGEDHAHAIALDGAGNAHVTGSTASADFPTTPDGDRSLNGSSDAFVAKFNATGAALLFSTFGGGSDSDRGNAIAVDGAGDVYVAGETSSGDFPTTPGALQPTTPSGSFVAKISGLGQSLLSVSVAGSGTVMSDPPGIHCPEDCAAAYVSGTPVTLSAIPAAGWQFDTWGGDCAGGGGCGVVMTADRSVTATFSRQSFSLTVSKAGGDGTVTSGPPGITCGATCSAAFPFETQVVLSAAPGVGFVFDHWEGDCTGATPSCMVPMTQARNVTAAFARPTPSLTVSKAGSGGGIVTAIFPPGSILECSLPCTLSPFAYGTSVTLSLSSISGSFTGWSGEGCSGTGSCNVVMTQDRHVTAVFAGAPATLALSLNQSSFQTGGNLSLTATTTPGTPALVDVYVALAMPGGTLLYLQGNGSLTPATQPLVSNWSPISFNGQIFQYHFNGSEPIGQYIWYAAFVGPGGNPLLGTIGPIVAAAFSFSP